MSFEDRLEKAVTPMCLFVYTGSIPEHQILTALMIFRSPVRFLGMTSRNVLRIRQVCIWFCLCEAIPDLSNAICEDLLCRPDSSSV